MWPVIGHDLAVNILEKSLQKEMLGHAYLFTGSQHAGKLTLAIALAQSLNCLSEAKPCGRCSQCLKIGNLEHPDVQIIKLLSADEAEDGRAHNEITITQIRDVRHWASLPPYEGTYRVFIINPAELLSPEAANCLLKTLEEPLGNTIFLLLTAEPGRLPETVISRCQKIELRAVAAQSIEASLVARGVESQTAKLLSLLSHGAPGMAFDLANDAAYMEERQGNMERILSVIEGNYAERFSYMSDITSHSGSNIKRQEIGTFMDQWLSVWRDIMLVKADAVDNLINIDFQARIASLAGYFSLEDINRFVRQLRLARRQLRQNVNIQLLLEVLMLDMPLVHKTATGKMI